MSAEITHKVSHKQWHSFQKWCLNISHTGKKYALTRYNKWKTCFLFARVIKSRARITSHLCKFLLPLVNCGLEESYHCVCITSRLCTVFPLLMKITHELYSKQSVIAGGTAVTCMYCDMSTWLLLFIPAKVATAQPSPAAVLVTKVN